MLKQAIINYSSVIKLKPDSSDAYSNRAALFEAKNELSFANEDYRILRGMDPYNERALYNLATYSFSKHIWNDSIAAFAKLHILLPENSSYLVYKGRAFAAMLKFSDAFDVIHSKY